MELTEKERLMLIERKDEILELTKEIIDILYTGGSEQVAEVKKKMTSILSLISAIASYAKPKNVDVKPLLDMTNLIFLEMRLLGDSWTGIASLIEIFCNTVNHIQFDFTKRDIKIKIPKIDLSIFKSR